MNTDPIALNPYRTADLASLLGVPESAIQGSIGRFGFKGVKGSERGTYYNRRHLDFLRAYYEMESLMAQVDLLTEGFDLKSISKDQADEYMRTFKGLVHVIFSLTELGHTVVRPSTLKKIEHLHVTLLEQLKQQLNQFKSTQD